MFRFIGRKNFWTIKFPVKQALKPSITVFTKSVKQTGSLDIIDRTWVRIMKCFPSLSPSHRFFKPFFSKNCESDIFWSAIIMNPNVCDYNTCSALISALTSAIISSIHNRQEICGALLFKQRLNSSAHCISSLSPASDKSSLPFEDSWFRLFLSLLLNKYSDGKCSEFGPLGELISV